MAIELRRVQALDACHSALILAFVLDANVVLEDVNAFGEVVDVEMGGRVAGPVSYTHLTLPTLLLV